MSLLLRWLPRPPGVHMVAVLALAACLLYFLRNSGKPSPLTERSLVTPDRERKDNFDLTMNVNLHGQIELQNDAKSAASRTSGEKTSQFGPMLRTGEQLANTLESGTGNLRQPYSAGSGVTEVDWDELGTMAKADGAGWSPLSCNTSQVLRRVDLPTEIGNLSMYVYGSASQDLSVTARALRGEIFERREITRFLQLTSDLPLIDVGANVGLVALQAALQGRQVVALEPVPDNAVRLCRAAMDFGHARLLHVVQNAISDSEGPVTLAMDTPRQSTHFTIGKGGQFSPTSAYAITLDRLLDVLPFHTAALKIDVESYEGHVLSAAERLFQQVDIPVVWLEWEHVKLLHEFGAKTILNFMRQHRMAPHNIMSGAELEESQWRKWPFTVLWKREEMR